MQNSSFERVSNNTAFFLILVPHRDTHCHIEAIRKKLFAAGFKGSYSFPLAAPLALLSEPLEKNELKVLANEIRTATIEKNGKITANEFCKIRCDHDEFFNNTKEKFWNTMEFFGPQLDLPLKNISGLKNKKISYNFPKTILCAAISNIDSPPNDENFSSEIHSETHDETQPFSFRAAMVANLAIRPLKSGLPPYSLEWQFWPECWLPVYKAK